MKIDSWYEEKDYWESAYKTVSFYYMGYRSPTLKKGDSVIVYSLSKLGSSLGKVIENVHSLTSREINVHSAEDDLQIGNFFQLKDMVYPTPDPKVDVFKVLSTLERKIVSERSTESLKVAKDKGRRLGRPKGRLGGMQKNPQI